MRSLLLLSFVGCASLNPTPPQMDNVAWHRYVLRQGATPRSFDSPRASLSSQPSLMAPAVLGADYKLDVVVRTQRAALEVACRRSDDGGVFECAGDHVFRSLALGDECRKGVLMTDSKQLTVSPWFAEETHVGFIVSDGTRPVAAIDTDHQWERPVWVDAAMADEATAVALDVLAYVLNDLVAVEDPWMCTTLLARGRFPR